MQVEDVMTRDPEVCRPEDDLATVAKVMWDLDCGCVPIVGDERRVVGMITDRDACMAAMMNGRPLHELRASDVMSQEIIACRPTDDLRDAQSSMRRRRVRRLPVVDGNGSIVGILSLHDIARAAKQARRRLFPTIRLKEVALTFAEVSQPSAKPAPPPMPANIAYAE